MLDYIKKQLAEQQAAMMPEQMSEAEENALITEYAHIFQELEDISVEGQDAYRSRSLELDIPIEDDIELDTVEINLTDGRIVDVPMDAIVNQENFVESMKTYADFYLEACEAVKPFMREDAYNLEERRQAWAKKRYDVYHEQMVQEGMYGFDKLSMDDDHVPANIMCDFGLLGVDDVQKYMVKSPVYFESADGTVVASQLSSLQVAKNEHIFESFGSVLANKLNVNEKDVWDVATPKRVIVPVPKDEYHVIVEFDCEGSKKSQYIGWKMSRKPSVRNGNIPENMYPSEASSVIANAIPLMNKKEFVKESYVPTERKLPSRWNTDNVSVYQEATNSENTITLDENAIKFIKKEIKRVISNATPHSIRGFVGEKSYGIEWWVVLDGKKIQCYELVDEEVIASDEPIDKANENIANYIRKMDSYKSGKPNRFDASLSSTIQESYMYQEAIDFGYPDENSEASNKNQPADAPKVEANNNDTPPELNSGDGNNDQPSVDANGDNPPADNPEENTPGEPIDSATSDEPRSPVETNDVSDQIAEKVSDQTTGEDTGADANGDISIDDMAGDDLGDNTDPNLDTSSTNNIDSELDSLDSTGGTGMDETPIGDPSNMNIDSMSIDDIMAQAAEKLKGMPIEQVKKFLSDGAGGLDDTSNPSMDDMSLQTESYQMEAFFITKKNVKQELDIAIRGCLGALNDANRSLNDIIVSFKKQGKKLNRVLGKAIKMTDVFSTEQTNHLNKLNSALVKLQTGLKPTASSDETNAVKALIKDFTSEAVVVGKFLENKQASVTTESYIDDDYFEEGFGFTTKKNICNRLCEQIGIIEPYMKELTRKIDNGEFNSPKDFRKWYRQDVKVHTTSGTGSTISGDAISTISTSVEYGEKTLNNYISRTCQIFKMATRDRYRGDIFNNDEYSNIKTAYQIINTLAKELSNACKDSFNAFKEYNPNEYKNQIDSINSNTKAWIDVSTKIEKFASAKIK